MKRLFTFLLLLSLLLSACAQAITPPSTETPAATITPEASATAGRVTYTPRPPTRTPRPTFTPPPTATSWPINVTLKLQAKAKGQSFSPFVLGSNLPNWLSKEQFESEQFRKRVAASGLTLIRIPGGSFSDDYGWLSCELGQNVPGALPCKHDWGRRPTDFINFFRGVEANGRRIEAMFIVNVNATAQEAAAVVAFFNAKVGDPTIIGLDRNGFDWKTAGEWAALRAQNGNPEPLNIRFWDIGNEVYGGKFGNPGCTTGGWETTWTCRGDEYILGTSQRDGVTQMRAAMLKVDPTILVGAVGGSDVVSGSVWSEAVLKSYTKNYDYFVTHAYPSYAIIGNPRTDEDFVLSMPQKYWPGVFKGIEKAIQAHAPGADLPIFMNEYELVPPWGKVDTRNYMNKHIDALFLADSLGLMISLGVDMAAQWAIMNGKSDDYGNEFGLMRADGSNDRQPKYYIYPLWARFGNTLLPLESSANPASELSAYAGRLDDGTLTLLVINKNRAETNATITFEGIKTITGGLADVLAAPSLDSTAITFNGNPNPADDLADAPSRPIAPTNSSTLEYTFAPISVTLLRISVKP
ncbi:MAG: alpha-L-arabinofuranosidase [Anaerolineales bacterium]